VPSLKTQHKTLLAFLLVASWLLATVFAFWWFQFRHQFSFSFVQDGIELPEQWLAELPKGSQDRLALVVHFYNQDCLCSRFNEAHVKEIIHDYAELGVDFLIAVPESSQLQIAEVTFGQHAILAPAMDFVGSPLALILDIALQPVYLGAYSDSLLCSTNPGQQVESRLDQLIQQNPVTPVQAETSAGCFCPWKSPQPSQ